MSEIIRENTAIGNPLHEWTILEYEKVERGKQWYVVMGIVFIGSLIYALATGNFLFAMILALFAIIFYLQAHQKPAQLPFVITDLGVIVGRRFHPYSEMEEFSIVYRPPEVKVLLFKTKNVIDPILRIPLLDADPIEIRYTLLEHMSENPEVEEEPFSDKISRNLGL